jgi:hypothetical protein
MCVLFERRFDVRVLGQLMISRHRRSSLMTMYKILDGPRVADMSVGCPHHWSCLSLFVALSTTMPNARVAGRVGECVVMRVL